MNPFQVSATVLIACLLGTGCVTQGTFDEIAAERDALRSENQSLEGRLVSLQERADAQARSLEQAETQLVSARVSLASMTDTHDELVSELREELESGQIQIRKVLDGIRLDVSDELLFASGSARLSDAGQQVIERVAERLKNDDSLVFVEGHTDNVRLSKSLRDRYATNWELAANRATVVVRVLSEAGVAPERLRAVSRGPFAPIASNDTADGRARNRRTEIVLRPRSAELKE